MSIARVDERLAASGWRRDASRDTRRLLADHPCFRGRAERFELFENEWVLMVRGRVPSFYLKQVLQRVLRNAAGNRRIDDRVDVVCSDGLSSVCGDDR
jgi:hypothetical protein